MPLDPSVQPTPIEDALTPERTVETANDQFTRGWLLAIDETTVERPLADFQVVLNPASCGSRFTVFRATDVLEIPSGSCLRPAVDAMTVRDDDYQYVVLKTALVAPSERAESDPGRLLTVPEAFQDALIVESPPTNPSLWDALTALEARPSTQSGGTDEASDASFSVASRRPFP